MTKKIQKAAETQDEVMTPEEPHRPTYAEDVRALVEAAARAPNSTIGPIDDIDFESLPPFGFSLEKPDPSLPKTAPAKLPDDELVAEALRRAEQRRTEKKTRRTRSKTPARVNPLTQRLMEAVRRTLSEAAEDLDGRVSNEFALVPLNPVRVVVAYSGGRDSTALLDVAAKLFADRSQSLVAQMTAVYVNHGLSPDADAWETHCRAECERRGVRFEALKVVVRPKGDGVEAAARDARYKALVAFAKREGADVILTAHHEDDRIETFLLQWMRGAGPEGLAAFPKVRSLSGLGATPTLPADREIVGQGAEAPILLARPWSAVPRSEIERYAKNNRLKWIEDESNGDPRFARNRVRSEIIPLLDALRPGFRHAAARSVELVAETVEVLKSVAATDLEACRSAKNPDALNLFKLLALIPARQAWCLRAWMTEQSMRLPSRARLEEALRQLRETHSDSALSLRVAGKEIRRWGGELVIREAPSPRRSQEEKDALLSWTGSDLPLPAWRGVLRVVRCEGREAGIDPARLAQGRLEVRSRRGGEKLKLWPLRPSKNLKDLYAEADIPSFERPELPLVWLDGELLFAAGLGLEIRAADDPDLHPERVRFVFDAPRLLEGGAVRNFGELSPEERRAHAARMKAEAEERRREERALRAKNRR